MSDICRTKTIEVEVQENGIIRGLDGGIIARLTDDASFEDLNGPVADLNETRSMIEVIHGQKSLEGYVTVGRLLIAATQLCDEVEQLRKRN